MGAAVVDTNVLLHQLATSGIDVGGIEFTSAYLTGGVFSYDGVHPTAFGYAFIANAFIDSINAKFGASIEPVDLYPYVFGHAGDRRHARGDRASSGPARRSRPRRSATCSGSRRAIPISSPTTRRAATAVAPPPPTPAPPRRTDGIDDGA